MNGHCIYTNCNANLTHRQNSLTLLTEFFMYTTTKNVYTRLVEYINFSSHHVLFFKQSAQLQSSCFVALTWKCGKINKL